jgi:hypothetical protein
VVKALPGVLRLPEPIALGSPPNVNTPGTARQPDKPSAPPTQESAKATLPIADLKPLYDAAVACKECQVELAAAQADLKDEKSKTDALSRERDDALRMAKGGSVLRRMARAAKWFLIGAAAGAVTAKLAR